MSRVNPLFLKCIQTNTDWNWQNTNDQSSYHSPVPQLIELLEPILDKVKNNQHIDIREDVDTFLSVLELSRREIDELENLAMFLLKTSHRT